MTHPLQQAIDDLEDLGFGDEDADINGGDAVDLINDHWDTLQEQVPKLLALRAAVAALIKAKGRFHTEQNYAALVAAFDKLEEP